MVIVGQAGYGRSVLFSPGRHENKVNAHGKILTMCFQFFAIHRLLFQQYIQMILLHPFHMYCSFKRIFNGFADGFMYIQGLEALYCPLVYMLI